MHIGFETEARCKNCLSLSLFIAMGWADAVLLTAFF